jgi:hypothetical protein
MKFSLQDKIDRDLALWLNELEAATGYGRPLSARAKAKHRQKKLAA